MKIEMKLPVYAKHIEVNKDRLFENYKPVGPWSRIDAIAIPTLFEILTNPINEVIVIRANYDYLVIIKIDYDSETTQFIIIYAEILSSTEMCIEAWTRTIEA